MRSDEVISIILMNHFFGIGIDWTPNYGKSIMGIDFCLCSFVGIFFAQLGNPRLLGCLFLPGNIVESQIDMTYNA